MLGDPLTHHEIAMMDCHSRKLDSGALNFDTVRRHDVDASYCNLLRFVMLHSCKEGTDLFRFTPPPRRQSLCWLGPYIASAH